MYTGTSIVGRAELKLAEAARAFRYSFRGKVVLDIGSSTGGFTEYALRQGAQRVIAIEKGTRQMKAPLRFDPRVELHEKTDFLEIEKMPDDKANPPEIGKTSDEKADSLEVGKTLDGEIGSFELGKAPTKNIDLEAVNTVVADVSFVSLREILLKACEILPHEVDYLVMLKPQFEARPEQLNRGVVKNEKMRREIMREFELWLAKQGFTIINKRDNELVGKVKGNRERFYWLKLARKVVDF